MRRLPLALAVLLALAGCDDTGVDDLTAEARSPDGRLVARLWCADFCDVAERQMLTIEPTDRAVTPTPGTTPQDSRRADLPTADIATILYANGTAPITIVWTAPRTLVFSVPCPSDGNMRAPGTGKVFRDVTILYRDSSNGAACR